MTISMAPKIRSTTVVAVLREGRLSMAADGQVTVGETVMKRGAEKVRSIAKGRVIVGFAGGAADALVDQQPHGQPGGAG